MKALSIKQPFASLIIEGLKDREHRKWVTNIRGAFIIHASKNPDKEFMEKYGFNKNAFDYGVLLGTVVLYDVKTYSNGIKAFLLKNPIKYKNPIPFKGKLNFFDVKIMLP